MGGRAGARESRCRGGGGQRAGGRDDASGTRSLLAALPPPPLPPPRDVALAHAPDGEGALEARLKFRKADSADEASATIRVALRGAEDELKKMPAGRDERELFERVGKLLSAAKVVHKDVDVIITIPGAAAALPELIAGIVRARPR